MYWLMNELVLKMPLLQMFRSRQVPSSSIPRAGPAWHYVILTILLKNTDRCKIVTRRILKLFNIWQTEW